MRLFRLLFQRLFGRDDEPGPSEPMHELVIDYILNGDGLQRGYNFVTPTDRVAPDVVRTVWRQAMPRGQGWGAPEYSGAHSLKVFPLPGGRVGVSDVQVTDKQDELGRGGIRRAEITVMSSRDYPDYLRRRWDQLPPAAREAADSRLGLRVWARVADQTLPKLKGRTQVILSYPFRDPADWQFVEAFVLKLMLSRRVRLLKGWGMVNPFTTLALDYHEESRLVVLPADKAAQVKAAKHLTVINIG